MRHCELSAFSFPSAASARIMKCDLIRFIIRVKIYTRAKLGVDTNRPPSIMKHNICIRIFLYKLYIVYHLCTVLQNNLPQNLHRRAYNECRLKNVFTHRFSACLINNTNSKPSAFYLSLSDLMGRREPPLYIHRSSSNDAAFIAAHEISC